MRIILLLSLLTVAYAQSVVNVTSINLDAASVAAIAAWMSTQRAVPSPNITVAAALNDTKITVSKTTGITTSSAISIDGEHMDVKVINGNDLTVTRGFNGTAKATHATNAEVVVMKYRVINDLGRQMVVDGFRNIVETNDIELAQKTAATTAKSKSQTGVQ